MQSITRKEYEELLRAQDDGWPGIELEQYDGVDVAAELDSLDLTVRPGFKLEGGLDRSVEKARSSGYRLRFRS